MRGERLRRRPYAGRRFPMDQNPLKNPVAPVVGAKADRRNELPVATVRYVLIGGLALAALSGVMMFVVQ
ncbi:hypothetical protein [Methylocella silvestris]|nr:hypothetical protein [Methylocella silvestris]